MTIGERRLCRRTGCGHPYHSGACMVQRVSGPASSMGRAVFDEAAKTKDNPRGEVGYEHVGRTVTRCDCPGFLA